MERVAGFEPASSAWKAEVLPLNDTPYGAEVKVLPYLHSYSFYKLSRNTTL